MACCTQGQSLWEAINYIDAFIFKDLFSIINHIEKMISNITITIETTTALYIIPMISNVKDITTDITE